MVKSFDMEFKGTTGTKSNARVCVCVCGGGVRIYLRALDGEGNLF